MSVLTDPPPYAVAAGAGAGASGASSAGTDSGPDANAINFDQPARQQPQQYPDVIASGSGASEAVDNGELLVYEPPPSSSTASSATFTLCSGQPTPSKEEYRDANWSVFFWLHLVVLFGASLLGFLVGSTSNDYSTGDNSYSDDSSSSGWTSSSSFTSGLLGTLFAGGACALLAIYAARRNTRATIYFAMWSTVGLTALMAILCFALFSIFLGVLFALLAVFLGLFITRQTKRIGFATKIMKYSLECMFVYPATVTISFGGLFAAVVWFVLWLIGLVGAIPPTLTSRTVYTYGYDSWSGEQYVTGQQTTVGASGLTYFVIIIYVFSLFWTCQVLQNVVGTTISGVAATWYFCYPVRQVVDPTRASFRRATTTSFGSVCLGSLVVGLLRTARFCLSMISTNNSCGECALFCGRWILKMLDSAFTYFNHYAFAQVAIYGKKYTTAACDTLELFKSRGLDAVLNDLFVGQAVVFLSLLSGLLTALVVLIVCSIAPSSFTSAWAVLGMFVGYAISATALGVIENTVICLFVCLAEDPAALYATKPEIYNDIIGELQSTYPQAQVVEPNPAV